MSFSAISLFTGAGGLDHGLEAAGIRTAVAVEIDRDCCATLEASRKWPIIAGPIEAATAKSILSKANLSGNEVDVIAAGPPCQPFSKSANWANGNPGGMADPRAGPLIDLFRLAEQIKPRLIVLENVPGFARHGGLVFVERRLKEINSLKRTNYSISAEVLDAANYGAPQHRRRLTIVADREGQPFTFPAPTHGPDMALPWVTSWDAIGDLVDDSNNEDLRPKGKWADLLPSIPEGRNYLFHTLRGEGVEMFGWRTRYWSFLLKLAKDQPSWTIAANPSQNHGPFHWDNRLLSTAELARLQTFPPEIRLRGTQVSQRRQIGNAVPSLLGEVLGRAIRAHLNPNWRPSGAPLLAIGSRPNQPRARRRTSVPAKYLSLAGPKTPHPGPGQGPRARMLRAGQTTSSEPI